MKGQRVVGPIEDAPDPAPRLSWTRRRVLQAASAGAALFAFGSAAGAREPAISGTVHPLSVGYLEDSDLLSSLRVQPWRGGRDSGGSIVPAAGLPLGDQSLALSTVEMRVHGFYPGIPSRSEATFTTVVLTVFFPSFDPLAPDPAAPVPFYSWQGRAWPRPTKAAPIRFVVPLREDGGLEMMLEVFDVRPTELGQRAARVLRGGVRRDLPLSVPIEQTSLYTDFTVDWYGGRPKLQRGFYFMGIEPGTWRTPGRLPGRLAPKSSPEAAGERRSIVVSFERVDDPDDQVNTAS